MFVLLVMCIRICHKYRQNQKSMMSIEFILDIKHHEKNDDRQVFIEIVRFVCLAFSVNYT